MPSKKIVFLGSKPIGYECLSYLVSQKDALDVEIVGLFTRARKEFSGANDLTAIAAEHNIPVYEDLAQIPECDILYSVQYHQVLRQHQLEKARELAVNLHMAPLPEYRGANQFSFAILDDIREFGTTIHKIDNRIDHGDILFQKRFPIPLNCWVGELYQLTFDASVNLFRQTLAHVVNGNYDPVPQQLLEPKYGTSLHFRNEMELIKLINLSWDAQRIERHVRAASMPGFEPPYCLVGGKKVFFTT